jgi:hypothetical protein
MLLYTGVGETQWFPAASKILDAVTTAWMVA